MNDLLILASETTHESFPLVLPAPVFAVIAASFFVFIGIVTFSYRDVAARHRQKWSDDDSHGGHH